MKQDQKLGEDEFAELRAMIYEIRTCLTPIEGYCKMALTDQGLENVEISDFGITVKEICKIVLRNSQQAFATVDEMTQYIIELQEVRGRDNE